MNTEEYWKKIKYFIELGEKYVNDYKVLKIKQSGSHIAYICGYLASAADLEYCKYDELPERITKLIGELAMITK
jgi:hypothetical protein